MRDAIGRRPAGRKPVRGVALGAALCALLAGCDDAGSISADPRSAVFIAPLGAHYEWPAAIGAGPNDVHWSRDLTRGFRDPTNADSPAEYRYITLRRACAVRPPSRNATINYVQTARGVMGTPLRLVDPGALDRWRDAADRSGGAPDLTAYFEGSTARLVDVHVTDVSGPQFLVLASEESVLWSIQVAPGAKVEGVVVVSNPPSALAHRPPGAEVTFLTAFNSPHRKCFPKPARPVDSTWKALARARDDERPEGFRTLISKHRAAHERWLEQIAAIVGGPDRRVSAFETSSVLVGPKPSLTSAYRTLDNSTVWLPSTARPYWGDAGAVMHRLRSSAGLL